MLKNHHHEEKIIMGPRHHDDKYEKSKIKYKVDLLRLQAQCHHEY